jgi:chromosomal replication initiation ATPase DnaA
MVTPALILEAVALEFGTTAEIIVGRRPIPSRSKAQRARATACLLLYQDLGWSYARIGRRLDGRDHSTIHYAVQTARSRLLDRPSYRAQVQRIRNETGIR